MKELSIIDSQLIQYTVILILSFRPSAFCVEEVTASVRFLRVRRKDLNSFSSYQNYQFFFPCLQSHQILLNHNHIIYAYCMSITKKILKVVMWHDIKDLFVKRLSCTSGVSVRDFVPQKMFPRLRVVVHCIFLIHSE